MTAQKLDGIWYYYLSLEQDLANTSRYIEPAGQENAYSFEFAKLLILSCTEVESVFKMICREIEGTDVKGDIGEYKRVILGEFPKIVDAVVTIIRWGKSIKPFEEWSTGKLTWWDAYQNVKHYRGDFFSAATYKNAATALAALYILIFYLAKICKLDIRHRDDINQYIASDYTIQLLCERPEHELPDFEGV